MSSATDLPGRRRPGIAWLAVALVAGACSGGPSSSPSAALSAAPSGPVASATRRPNDIPQPPSTAVTLTGVGATLPQPLYQIWFDRFDGTYPSVSIAYDASGSEAGITAVLKAGATFGASDVAMTDAEVASAPGKILHVPMALGAVVVVVNLPGVASVQLDGPTLASIFLGKVGRWNDAAIAAVNPGVTLPDLAIGVVHRSDASGTTNAFVTYLDATSPEWHAAVGIGRSVTWPVGTGAAGDSGVADAVKGRPGAIGYAASALAAAAGLRTAKVRNAAGNFVRATMLGIASAAEAAVAGLPADFRQAPPVNEPGVNAYPIVVYAYLLVLAEQPDAAVGSALVALLGWCLTTGQVDAAQAGFAALPGSVQQKALASLHGITHAGTPIWP